MIKRAPILLANLITILVIFACYCGCNSENSDPDSSIIGSQIDQFVDEAKDQTQGLVGSVSDTLTDVNQQISKDAEASIAKIEDEVLKAKNEIEVVTDEASRSINQAVEIANQELKKVMEGK